MSLIVESTGGPRPIRARRECLRSAHAIAEIACAWRDLFDRTNCTTPFLSYEWISEWCRFFLADSLPFVIAVWSDAGVLIGLAPLRISKRRALGTTIRRLGWMADDIVGSDYLDILVEPAHRAEVLAEVADTIRASHSEWDFCELLDVDSRAALSCQLVQDLQLSGMRLNIRPRSRCPYVNLPSTFEEYLAGLGKEFRKQYRQACREIARAGAVEMTCAEGDDALHKAWHLLIDLHQRRMAQRGVASAFTAPPVQDFHRCALDRLAAAGMARLYTLRVGDAAAGALYGFSVKGKFSFFAQGFDPVWAAYRIGNILTGKTIEAAIRTKHTEFDFLRGSEPYKYHWARQEHQTLCLQAFGPDIRSQWARYALFGSQAWQYVRRRLR